MKSNVTQLDASKLVFGKVHTDHMMLAKFAQGQWGNANIQPFEPLELSPFSLCFHYGQTVFEGLKAFKREDGEIAIFRADQNFERLNKSLVRMAMPEIPEELYWKGLTDLIQKDIDWIPNDPEASLYIRPFVIATEPLLGVRISSEYYFMIVCCPVGAYYSKALNVKLEKHFSRAASGGTGYAKCGGNYGGAYYPWKKAQEEGYDQILWTDAKNHEYLEESGTMNVMFIIDDVLLTPPTSDSILNGITRDSLLTIAKDRGMQISEEKIHYQTILDAIESGKKVEAFGAGTAAVISPIQSIGVDGKAYQTYVGEDATMFQLKQELVDIRLGKKEDKYGWNYLMG